MASNHAIQDSTDGYSRYSSPSDVDQAISAGISLNGKGWGRPDDTIGATGILNGIDFSGCKILPSFVTVPFLGIKRECGAGKFP
jgi:hypothetical protein